MNRKARRVMDRKIVERLLGGAGVNEICRELKVGKRRVTSLRAKADEAGYLTGEVVLPPYPEALFPEAPDGRSLRVSAHWEELDEHLEWIRERMESGWHAVTVFEELPVKVPRSSFYRFLIRHHLNEIGRSSRRRVVPEIVHKPGEALLIDWGLLWNEHDSSGRLVRVWVFVGVLGRSRFLVARVMTSCAQEATLAALSSMYEELGGVPQRTTSDNPKIFAKSANRFETIIHPLYERFASHYGTTVECLPPHDPQKKGKVERPMPFIRRLMESYDGDRTDVAEIEHFLTRKLAIANARKHGTTGERPVDCFSMEEKSALKSLPPLAYEVEHYHEGTVRTDGHVRFLGKYYSLPEEYIRKDVTIIGGAKTVSIYFEGRLIETHERITDPLRSKSTKRAHLKPWEQICDNDKGLTARAGEIGAAAEAIVRQILQKGDGYVDFRKIWGILSLVKKYPRESVEEACRAVFAAGSTSYWDVRRLLEASATPTPASSPRRGCGKYQRDLSEYTQMLLNLKPEGGVYEH